MYGWRGRLGLILPCVNTTMEPEFNKVLPEGISCHASRVVVDGKFDIPSLVEMANGTERAAEELKSVADVIGYGCTSGSFAKGVEWDKELIERMHKISGIPATTTSSSIVNALNMLGVKKISLATPYTHDVTLQQKRFFEEQKFQVLDMKYLNVTEHGGQGIYYPSTAYHLAKQAFKPDAEAIVISCTNFRTFEIIETIENDLGIPVVTANQATLWQMLRMLKVNVKMERLGHLFEI